MTLTCPNCGISHTIFPGARRIFCDCGWSAFLVGDSYTWQHGWQPSQQEQDARTAHDMIVQAHRHKIEKYKKEAICQS